MYGHGKCQKCGTAISYCEMDQIIVGNQVSGPFFHGVAMCCPNGQCHAVLGVSIDPSSLVADIVHQVARKIQG